jgi:hypothetical protein
MRYHERGSFGKTLLRVTKYANRGFWFASLVMHQDSDDEDGAAPLCCLYDGRAHLHAHAVDTATSQRNESLIKLGFLAHVQTPTTHEVMELSIWDIRHIFRIGHVDNGATVHVPLSMCARWAWGCDANVSSSRLIYAMGRALTRGDNFVVFARFQHTAGPHGPAPADFANADLMLYVSIWVNIPVHEGGDW